jgi:DNA-binding MarR family transcriptional regulator
MTQKNEPNSILRLEDYWPYQVTVLADRIARRTSSIVKRYELNLSQWRVLAAVAEVPGRTSVEVVTITPMDKGIVSRATKALLEMELLQRVASQSDGRISHLHMTDRGQTLYQTILPQVLNILEGVGSQFDASELERLSDQLKSLLKVVPDLR